MMPTQMPTDAKDAHPRERSERHRQSGTTNAASVANTQNPREQNHSDRMRIDGEAGAPPSPSPPPESERESVLARGAVRRAGEARRGEDTVVRVSPERVRGDAETVQVSPERVRCVRVCLERSVAPNGDATRSARAFERPRDGARRPLSESSDEWWPRWSDAWWWCLRWCDGGGGDGGSGAGSVALS